MKTKAIFNKLLELGISQTTIYSLEMQASCVGDIGIVLGLARIVENYEGTREQEDEVCKLLSLLCKNHFKNVKK